MQITLPTRENVPVEWKDWEDTFVDEIHGLWPLDLAPAMAPAGGASSKNSGSTCQSGALLRSSLSSSSLSALDIESGLDATMVFNAIPLLDDPFDSLLGAPLMTPSFGSFTDLLAVGSPLPDVQALDENGSIAWQQSEDAVDEERPCSVRTPPPEPPVIAVASPPREKVTKKGGTVASRKRKMIDTSSTGIPSASSGKRVKTRRSTPKLDEQTEKLYRKRFEILHEILEAWNTGGIEDMEEIAPSVYHDDIKLVSPDYSEGLCGVKPIMEHWNILLDAFPDGIMEEYNIQRDDPAGERMHVSWIFSGTQIFPFFGLQPRHQKVTIRGSSHFIFKGDKISEMVLMWNYREALMQLMGSATNSETSGNTNSVTQAAG